MQIFYRVLEVNEGDASIVVRYWSDELSERELSSALDETSDTPVRCKTDYNINIWEEMDDGELHDFIMASAPVQWLELKGKTKRGEVSLHPAVQWVGQTRTADSPAIRKARPAKAEKSPDITAMLANDEPGDFGPVILERIYNKLTGPWTQPSNYTGDEMGIVNLYIRKVYSFPGILGLTQNFRSSDVFARQYKIDTVDHARAIYRGMTDPNDPDVQAMRDLAKGYQTAAGTTYDMQWRLLRA